MVIGILAITALPTVTGIAEGVHHQRLQNKEAADETRLAKFHLDVFCSTKSSKKAEVDKGLVFLRDDKV